MLEEDFEQCRENPTKQFQSTTKKIQKLVLIYLRLLQNVVQQQQLCYRGACFAICKLFTEFRHFCLKKFIIKDAVIHTISPW